MKSFIRVLFTAETREARQAVAQALRKAGFEAVLAQNDPQALDICLDYPIDLTILGIIQPIINSLKTLQSEDLPVLLIRTGQGVTSSDPAGEQNGAQVITVRPSDLIECVRRFLQTGEQPDPLSDQIYCCDDLSVDLGAHLVLKRGQIVRIPPVEFRLLQYFVQRMGKLVSKTELLHNVWGCPDFAGDFNMVETAIMRLRRAIEDNPRQPRYLQTVWGRGYRFGWSRANTSEAERDPENNRKLSK